MCGTVDAVSAFTVTLMECVTEPRSYRTRWIDIFLPVVMAWVAAM